jgi:large subunit ribosomal protein L23
MPDLYRAIVRPVVTEKSSARYAQYREYTFAVDPRATKREIREAIERLFDVTVVAVRTSVQRAKRRTLGRTLGRRPRWKKAYVRLKEGDAIAGIYEG